MKRVGLTQFSVFVSTSQGSILGTGFLGATPIFVGARVRQGASG